MKGHVSTDYETYREIMDELLCPISPEGLDNETLKRLYESKLVYLENLREKCFWELNTSPNTFFSLDDHALILRAIKQSRECLREIIRMTIVTNLAKRKVV